MPGKLYIYTPLKIVIMIVFALCVNLSVPLQSFAQTARNEVANTNPDQGSFSGNKINSVKIINIDKDHADIKVDYFFNKKFKPDDIVSLEFMLIQKGKVVYQSYSKSPRINKHGRHSLIFAIKRPLPISKAFTTDLLRVTMTGSHRMDYAYYNKQIKMAWPATSEKILGIVRNSVKIVDKDIGYVLLSLKYYYNYKYTAEKKYYKDIYLDISARQSDSVGTGSGMTRMDELKAGQHEIKVRIRRSSLPSDAVITTYLNARFYVSDGDVLIEHIPLRIVWPSANDYEFVEHNIDKYNIHRRYHKAVYLINKGGEQDLDYAKAILDKIVEFDSSYLDAYPQLAKYELIMHRNQKGLKKAEKILGLALSQNKNHVDSLIELGLVYIYEKNFRESEKLFARADKLGTRNLWLYTNWGQLYAIKGNTTAATKKWQHCISFDRPPKMYDQAQYVAYENLLAIYNRNNNLPALAATFKSFMKKYSDHPCVLSKYAEFQLVRNGDYRDAKKNLRDGINGGCKEKDMNTMLSGVISYYEWAENIDKDSATRLLIKARLLYPENPYLFEYMAHYETLHRVLELLTKHGANINSVLDDGTTALTLSIQNKDLNGLKFLIKIGAAVNKAINDVGVTPLMLAISVKDREMVKALIDSGADMTAKLKNGITVSDFAKHYGMTDIIGAGVKGI